jgi:hypothetical protein
VIELSGVCGKGMVHVEPNSLNVTHVERAIAEDAPACDRRAPPGITSSPSVLHHPVYHSSMPITPPHFLGGHTCAVDDWFVPRTARRASLLPLRSSSRHLSLYNPRSPAACLRRPARQQHRSR